jgi:leader peptidase (prepilin peptidase)/N-methyltransferase
MSVTASGAALGSAAGCALARWPHGGSLLTPRRSCCSECGTAVRARDLIPVVSWLLLRGRCRACSATIDVRLPLLEFASAVAATSVVLVHGPSPIAGLLVIGAVAVLLASLTDIEDRTVPDRLTLPLAAVALPGMIGLVSDPGGRERVLLWAVLVPAVIEAVARLAVALGRQRPVGGGDVKLLVGLLALSIAVPSGPHRLMLLSIVLGGVHATVGLLLGRLRRGDRMPFAPAIALAFLTVVLLPDAPLPSPFGPFLATTFPTITLQEVV